MKHYVIRMFRPTISPSYQIAQNVTARDVSSRPLPSHFGLISEDVPSSEETTLQIDSIFAERSVPDIAISLQTLLLVWCLIVRVLSDWVWFC